MIPVRHIFLIGLSGSGKTTVGQELAKKLNWPFIDIDQLVEKKARQKLADIFDKKGEPFFRRMESNAIKELAIKSKKNTVIALGGGAFENKSTRDWILLTGVSIWLKSSIAVLADRLIDKTDRPLLLKRPRTRFRSKAELKRKLKEQLERRLPNFEQVEFKVVTSNKSPSEVAIEIEQKIMKKYA